MASSTAQTEYCRMLRRKNAGVKARRARENRGTTPVFPIHTPEADANALVALQKSQADAQA